MGWIDPFLAHYGYAAIFCLLMLGIVGPLIPDDTILVLSGLAAQRGRLDLAATIAVAYAGSLCGITLSYALGRTGLVYVLERFGPVERWVNRHMPRVQDWFERYGKWTLFFGYFVAGVRHFTALAAGMSGVRARVFAAYAYPGGLVWVCSFVLVGYYAGQEWEALKGWFERGGTALAICAAGVGLAVWWWRRRRAKPGS